MTANLFLADLGPGLVLTPQTLRDACFAVRRNRERWLLKQRTRQLIEMIAHTAEQWLEPDNGFRAMALRDGPAETGFGPATLARGIDGFFRQLTVENLEGLIAQDLGDVKRLDDFSAGTVEVRGGRMSLARGPELLGHIAAGNLPNPAWFSLVLGLLTRSAQVMKCPSGGALLPRLFAHSLAATESKLGACLELVLWPGGSTALEDVLFSEADCLTATGDDAMLDSVRRRLPNRCRLVGYGHRVSFAFIAREMLVTYALKRLVRAAADDVTAWNQLGCLSPHVLYIEQDGVVDAEGFAVELAAELARREVGDPRGAVSTEEAAAIATRRAAYDLRAAVQPLVPERNRVESVFFQAGGSVRLWQSEGSTAWTVVLDSDPEFQTSCLNRFLVVKPVKSFADVLRFAEPIRPSVSTVALAAPDDRALDCARQLARWGVSRVCPLGRMQEPPVAWRHDGRPALGDLITWTDFET
jgi:hypothetical protein